MGLFIRKLVEPMNLLGNSHAPTLTQMNSVLTRSLQVKGHVSSRHRGRGHNEHSHPNWVSNPRLPRWYHSPTLIHLSIEHIFIILQL